MEEEEEEGDLSMYQRIVNAYANANTYALKFRQLHTMLYLFKKLTPDVMCYYLY